MILTEIFSKEADLYEKEFIWTGTGSIFVIIVILFAIGSIGEAREPKCIMAGCNNKQASGSSFCYLHKSYKRRQT